MSDDTNTAPPRLAIFVATSGHSGVDRVVRNLAPAIAERGVQVDVLRVHGHGPPIEAEPQANLRIVELDAGHAYTALGPLIRYLRRHRPNALLTDKDRVNRIAILAHRLARSTARLVVRTGTTISSNLAGRKPIDRRINLWSMRYLYRLADAIVLPSKAAADDFAETVGLDRGRVTVCPSPIATPALSAHAAEPLDTRMIPPGDGPLIIGIGELSARKDYRTALRAFAGLDPARGARLLILGEGKKRCELETLARDLGVAERVALPGFVGNPYPALAQAGVFVHAARLEGAPVAVMEAVALGRPVVSTDCPSGPREILQDGRLGRLVSVGDAAAMCTALADLLDAPPSAATIRRGAAGFSLAASTDAYLHALGMTTSAPATARA
jgi:glycosyltransferase involved in cell wall biosynthesis